VVPSRNNIRHQVLEDPAGEDLSVEDPAVEDSSVEDRAVEDLSVEDRAVEDLSVEDPAVEDSLEAMEDQAVEASSEEDHMVVELLEILILVMDAEVARSDLQVDLASLPRLPEISSCTLPPPNRSKPFPQDIFPTPKFISTTSSSVPRTASVDPMPLLFLPPSRRLSSTFSTNAPMLSTKKSSKCPPPQPNLKCSSSTTIRETTLNSQEVFLCNRLLARASNKARPSMGVVELHLDLDLSVLDPSVVDPSVVDISVVDLSVVDLSVLDLSVVDISVVDLSVVDLSVLDLSVVVVSLVEPPVAMVTNLALYG